MCGLPREPVGPKERSLRGDKGTGAHASGARLEAGEGPGCGSVRLYGRGSRSTGVRRPRQERPVGSAVSSGAGKQLALPPPCAAFGPLVDGMVLRGRGQVFTPSTEESSSLPATAVGTCGAHVYQLSGCPSVSASRHEINITLGKKNNLLYLVPSLSVVGSSWARRGLVVGSGSVPGGPRVGTVLLLAAECPVCGHIFCVCLLIDPVVVSTFCTPGRGPSLSRSCTRRLGPAPAPGQRLGVPVPERYWAVELSG